MMATPFVQDIPLYAPEHLEKLWSRFQKNTMIGRSAFIENLQIVEHAARYTEGAFVECGTWKGGMSAAMMAIGGVERQYHFFDSFQGLPEAKDIDGEAAKAYQKDKENPYYYDNCRANIVDFVATISQVGVPEDKLHVHQGWFEDTIPRYDGGAIAVLRLDGDWYASTMQCLKTLYPLVRKGGMVIVDDYQYWHGATRAVHDYLSSVQSISAIGRTATARVAFIQKEELGMTESITSPLPI